MRRRNGVDTVDDHPRIERLRLRWKYSIALIFENPTVEHIDFLHRRRRLALELVRPETDVVEITDHAPHRTTCAADVPKTEAPREEADQVDEHTRMSKARADFSMAWSEGLSARLSAMSAIFTAAEIGFTFTRRM